MTDDPTAFTYDLRIEASPEIVFAHFTDPARMARWMGIDHKLDPTPGGAFMVNVNGRDIAVGEWVDVDPPRRAVFTWGWQGSTDVPPGSTTVEINLVADGDHTVLHFSHRGLPAGEDAKHAVGWTHYLARLGIAAGGCDPGPDTLGGHA